MKTIFLIVALVNFSISFQAFSVSPTQISKSEVVIDPMGFYQTDNAVCRFEVKIDGMGGFRMLNMSIQGKEVSISDVTAVGVVKADQIIISISPVYGKPGIAQLDCIGGEVREIVKAKHKSKTYPNGSDYFQLSKIFENEISYLYFPDMDQADLSKRDQVERVRVKN